MKFHIKIF
ncbi:hypothetical protein KGM_216072A, partial [Danaus plexippus plexippus]